MEWIRDKLEYSTSGQGMYEITDNIEAAIRKHNVEEGLCYLFIQHTSASLVISENADPTAKMDLESFINRIAPENQSWYQHTLEGADDSPSHMKSIITGNSETIPIDLGRLSLGTWQGIFLFEHRKRAHRRKVLLRILKVN